MRHPAPGTGHGSGDGANVRELRRVCDAIYRSSTAREALCQAIHEPSPEIALRHLGEFAEDAGVWRRADWSREFLSDAALTRKVELVLERVAQWHMVRKAPRRVVMEEPWDWYPRARLTRRSFIFHYGPTNSGKTHAALAALTAARSGVYCAPLKALAGQVWARLNESVPCDLLIGDERRFGGAAEHVSCTVEMTPIDLPVDVGVIDEIQMIGDRDRGWAWTRALLGLPAREIHLCGEERALPLVEELLYKTFERGRLRRVGHDRLVPLTASPPLGGSLSNVANGDCVVCFSKKAVVDTHRALGRLPGVTPSCIYGALPFEVRERQAAVFNAGVQAVVQQQQQQQSEPEQEGGQRATPTAQPHRHVLVSTDAIAYGLNMNIERIVFTAMKKFDGTGTVDLPPATVKQICGRAGRYGLVRRHPMGRYTTLHDGPDYAQLTSAMQAPLPNLTRAGLLPTADILQLYIELEAQRRAKAGPSPSAATEEPESFAQLMERFAASCEATGLFFPCDLSRSLLRVARLLEGVPALPLSDRILFCYLPLSDSSRESMNLLVLYAQDHAAGRTVPLRIDANFSRVVQSRSYAAVSASALAGSQSTSGRVGGGAHGDDAERQRLLASLERMYRQAEMYCWLAWRFQNTFRHREEGTELKQRIASEIEKLV